MGPDGVAFSRSRLFHAAGLLSFVVMYLQREGRLLYIIAFRLTVYWHPGASHKPAALSEGPSLFASHLSTQLRHPYSGILRSAWHRHLPCFFKCIVFLRVIFLSLPVPNDVKDSMKYGFMNVAAVTGISDLWPASCAGHCKRPVRAPWVCLALRAWRTPCHHCLMHCAFPFLSFTVECSCVFRIHH